MAAHNPNEEALTTDIRSGVIDELVNNYSEKYFAEHPKLIQECGSNSDESSNALEKQFEFDNGRFCYIKDNKVVIATINKIDETIIPEALGICELKFTKAVEHGKTFYTLEDKKPHVKTTTMLALRIQLTSIKLRGKNENTYVYDQGITAHKDIAARFKKSKYFFNIDREEAAEKLKDKPVGTFLLRPNSKYPDYVISISYVSKKNEQKESVISASFFVPAENCAYLHLQPAAQMKIYTRKNINFIGIESNATMLHIPNTSASSSSSKPQLPQSSHSTSAIMPKNHTFLPSDKKPVNNQQNNYEKNTSDDYSNTSNNPLLHKDKKDKKDKKNKKDKKKSSFWKF